MSNLRHHLDRAAHQDLAARLRPNSRPAKSKHSSSDSDSGDPSSESGEKPASTTVVRATDRALEFRVQLHARLLDELAEQNLLTASDAVVESAVREKVRETIETEELPLNDAERERLADDLVEETLGTGPLAPLMQDPAISDILVNGPSDVFVERHGRLEKTSIRFRDDDHLLRVIERIAARIGRRIDQNAPMADLRLPDGSRVNATIPPISIDYPTLSIRRFGARRLRRSDLERLQMLTPDMGRFLATCVQGRCNVLVSGGTGAGKSTLLGALCESIPAGERVVTIEDTAELVLDQPHVVRMETRPPNVEGVGRITARDLVINALRMRPNRILVGEVRGGEALDMLQAMNTGHDGSLTTIHANAPRDALSRLETMVLMGGLDLPSRAIREQIVSALDLVVHISRFEDGVRRVESITEVTGLEGETPLLQEIFRFERQGISGRRVQGRYVATGLTPNAAHRLRERGLDLPTAMFERSNA